MKNPLILQTEGNQRTAFNRDMVMVVRDQGAGRNAKIVLVNGLQYDVLHPYEYVMKALEDAEVRDVGVPGKAETRAAENSLPAPRLPVRNVR